MKSTAPAREPSTLVQAKARCTAQSRMAQTLIAITIGLASLAGLPALGQTATPSPSTPGPSARVLEGVKTIYAVTRDGQKIAIGQVKFVPEPDGVTRFSLAMDGAMFSDHFLSMKEFKCLEGAEISCHVVYPYNNPQTITHHDFAWLEHSLLFLFKQPRDFGAKLWNGSYYRLQADGQGLVGYAQAIDLNHISAPSDTPGVPPYSADLRADVAPGTRWLDHLRIQ
jgi:hypothetical protein